MMKILATASPDFPLPLTYAWQLSRAYYAPISVKSNLAYSRAFRKRPPNMPRQGDRFREMVAYEGSDHTGSKFCFLSVW